MLWLIPANPNIYDIESAFNDLEFIDWRKNANYSVGDYVYIYVSRPIQTIEYLCEVIETYVDKNSLINDKKYWRNPDNYDEITRKDYVRFKLIKQFNFDNLSVFDIQRRGMAGNIQGPRKMLGTDNSLTSWAEYILETTNTFNYYQNTREENDEVLTVPINGTLELIEKYNVHAHPLTQGYPQKVPKYIAFRETGGVINAVYQVEDVIEVIPDKYIGNDNVYKYIQERKNTFKFSKKNIVYRFYLIKLLSKLDSSFVLSPNPQGAKYLYLHDLIKNNKYSNFWNRFISIAYSNKIFSNIFKKSNVINRSYYDLRWEDNEMHLAIRNSSTKCLEVYIQESVELYHFFNENFEELKKGTNGIWTIPTKTIENETKHKKFVLSYDSENYNDDLYITWIIQEALQLKENIVLMLKKRNRFIVQRNEEEDTKIKVAISNVKRSEKRFQYSSDLKLKTTPKIIHGISIYKREKQVALNALNHANYKCEVDEDHKCFLRKDGETPYTEAHHLVPLSFQDDFEYSLDIEENIVSLCSNCHNEIHYGYNAKNIISQLYEERKDLLKGKGIDITLEKLLSYYGY